MRYRREGDIILISRNKRHLLKKVKVKEEWRNEAGCIACALFEVCLNLGKEKSTCERMAESGIISKYNYKRGDHYFINVR